MNTDVDNENQTLYKRCQSLRSRFQKVTSLSTLANLEDPPDHSWRSLANTANIKKMTELLAHVLELKKDTFTNDFLVLDTSELRKEHAGRMAEFWLKFRQFAGQL